MNPIEVVEAACPCCGEPVTARIDVTAVPAGGALGGLQWTEDCPVCCQPLVFTARPEPDTGDWSVEIRPENA